MKYSKYIIVSITACAALFSFSWLLKPAEEDNKPTLASKQSQDDMATPATSCNWTKGDRSAFVIHSEATAENHTDRFSAVMSWEVEQVTGTSALIRAGLSQIQLKQALSAEAERANLSPETPFYLTMNSSCLIVDSGFSWGWDANSIKLIRAQLSNLMFTLPSEKEKKWSHSLEDGIGFYDGLFSLEDNSPLTVKRTKAIDSAYSQHDQFGVRIQLNHSHARATFETTQPLWWDTISGTEELLFRVSGDSFLLSQKFDMYRDDNQFQPVPQADASKALFGEFAIKQSGNNLLPPTSHTSYTQAKAAFEQHIHQTTPSYVKAAMELAAWLKANPDDVALIVAELRGDLDDTARPTAFLALEMSATEEAKDALISLLDDSALSESDQAAAASALVDIGEPTQEVADVLMARATKNDMAANVSTLGIGSMLSRSKDQQLTEFLKASVRNQYQSASSTSELIVAIDTVSNSRDRGFTDILEAEINSESRNVRKSAANAIATVAPSNASNLLLERLKRETDSSVNTALVNAMTKMEIKNPQALITMESKLIDGDIQQRSAVVEWLGGQGSEEAKNLLVKQFKNEKDVRIKEKIGRFVTAAELVSNN